jgi:hypothetical protein
VNSGSLSLEITGTQLKTDPKIIIGNKSHTQYHITGRDSLGVVDILRRYSEFAQLRQMLFARYPGLLIPPIPGKQVNGKMQATFVDERKYFLSQFLNAICETSYLATSPEL